MRRERGGVAGCIVVGGDDGSSNGLVGYAEGTGSGEVGRQGEGWVGLGE